MANPGSDRRKPSRMLVELRVELRHLGRPRESWSDLTRALAQGGVFVDTTVALPVGTEVALEVTPGPGQRPLHFRTVVRRVEEEGVVTGSRVTGRTRGMALEVRTPESSDVAALIALTREMAEPASEGSDGSNAADASHA